MDHSSPNENNAQSQDIQRHELDDADWLMNNALRKESGERRYNDPLVSFMYHLIRDHLPAGVVEGLVWRSIKGADALYSNGWLADYANNIATRLKTPSSEVPADEVR